MAMYGQGPPPCEMKTVGIRVLMSVSALQLDAVAKVLERVRIGERLDVLHGAAMNDFAHGELDDLAALRPRDLGHLQDLRGHVPRRRVLADAYPDPRREHVVERQAVAQLHEQHDAHVVLPLLRNDERLEDLVDLLHLAVDLGRPDAHAARVQDGVGAAVDDEAAVLRELGVVAVTPDAGIALEVRGAILRSVRIVPESDRHRGEGAHADELATLAADDAT